MIINEFLVNECERVLLVFDFFVFAAGVNAARNAGRFLLATRAEVGFVEESAKEHEVAEVHAG